MSCIAENKEGSVGVVVRIILNKRRNNGVEVRRKERDARQKAVEETSHFNFIKMHLPLHYWAHVEQLGAIDAFSMESGESAHKRQVKEGYNHSNYHNVNKQIIEYYTRISVLSIRKQNLKQLVKEEVYSDEVKTTLKLLSPASKLSEDILFLLFADWA